MAQFLARCMRILIILPIFLYAAQNPLFNSLSSEQTDKFEPLLKKVMIDKSENKTSVARSFENARIENSDQIRAIIYTQNPGELVAKGIQVNSVLPDFVTVHATIDQLLSAATLNTVTSLSADRYTKVTNDVARGVIGADMLHSGFLNNTEYQGEGVIVCIYDTGIDYEHQDFRDPDDPTKSRILYIWDQTINATGSETAPSETGCNFGVEYTQAQIEDEINGVTTGFVREQDINGHGTHVAGTAAGNGSSIATMNYAGMAPKADIIVVKGGDGGFSTADFIDGLTYCREKAASLGKPVVVNYSAGSQSGPHDGTSSGSQAINSFVDAGRAVVKSAGNEGNDLIHKSGTVPANSSTTITFTIPSYTPESGSDNDDLWFEVWFDDNAVITAQLQSPNGDLVTTSTGDDRDVDRSDGSVYMANYMDANNNDRYVISIIYDGVSTVTPAAGTWTLTLTSSYGIDLGYHMWFADAVIGAESASVSLTGSDSEYTNTATAAEVISVASYTHRWYWYTYLNEGYNGGAYYLGEISDFSSVGPTRDNREKPDIAAPGDKIASAMSQWSSPSTSRIVPGQKHVLMQGTSMACPVVAGAVALLFEQNPNLDYSQLLSLLTNNADLDDYTGSTVWDPVWGYGKLNVFEAMGEALSNSSAQSEVLVYDQDAPYNGAINLGYGENEYPKASIRFTPSISGQVTGCYIQTYILQSNTDPHPLTGTLDFEIWTNSANKPGSKLSGTNTVSISSDQVSQYTMHYFNLLDAHALVEAGQDYHIVVSLPNSLDALPILSEYDNGTPDYRSCIFTSSGWLSGISTHDFVIRPVVTAGAGSIVPVTLSSLSVSYTEETGAVLKWQTKSEIRNLGFNIMRAVTAEGPWTKINSALIAGAGTSTQEHNYEYVDNSIQEAGTVFYKVEQIDTDGTMSSFGPVSVEVDGAAVPKKFALRQNYPNPFNAHTTIEYDVPRASNVRLTIFNTRGELVKELCNSEQSAGSHRLVWDGTSNSGTLAASGIYFVKMQAGDFQKTFKMLFAK